MFRIDHDDAAVALPTPAAAGSAGYYTDGDPAVGTAATVVTADHLNAIQEELCYAIDDIGGETLSKTDRTQLGTVIGPVRALKSHATDTGSATCAHTRGLLASTSSQASGAESACVAADDATASGANSSVVASDGGTASGASSAVVGGDDGTASGDFSFVGGGNSNTASGEGAAVIGASSGVASGDQSVVIGSGTVTNNVAKSLAGGNGSGMTWRIESVSGDAYSDGTWGNGAADYAECFENAEQGKAIPVGSLVALTPDKVRPTCVGDDVLGIVSAAPSMLGNAAPLAWQGRYESDEFGVPLYDDIESVRWPTIKSTDKDKDKAKSTRKGWTGPVADAKDIPKDAVYYTDRVRRCAAGFDISREYTPRAKRPEEWTVVGLLGQIATRVSPDVKPGNYIEAGKGGIGAPAQGRTNIRCMRVLAEHTKKRGCAIALCFIR